MKKHFSIALILFAFAFFTACKKDNIGQDATEIARYDLRFIEVTGENISAHGNHFHGLKDLLALDTVLIQYDKKGQPITNPHIHLESDAVYQLQIKAVNYLGQELPQSWIIRGEEATHALFIAGSSLALNGLEGETEGAILQVDPRLILNQPAAALSYFFRYGTHQNEESDLDLVLLHLKEKLPASKPTGWWNQLNPNSSYPGEVIVRFPVEIHVSESHGGH
jgi:hypothetical protein